MVWKFTDERTDDAGSVGGDIQVGAAWSRRLVWSDDAGNPLAVSNDGAPVFAVIDTAYYAADINLDRAEEDRPAPEDYYFDIQNQWCGTLCTDLDDVGGSEVYCDYEYEYVNALGFPTAEAASDSAKYHATHVRADAFGEPENWE